MKMRWLYAACCLSFMFAACSEDNNENFIENVTDDSVIVDGLEFKKLTTMELTSSLGSVVGSDLETRGPQDVDDKDRPLGRYPLDYLYILTTLPEHQPTKDDIYGNGTDSLGYVFENQTKFYIDGPFDLTFSLDPNNVIDESGKYTDAGSAYLKLPGGSIVEVKLSITDKENLKEEQIIMNDLAYDYCSEIGVDPRGSSVYYTSYDVQNPVCTLPEDENQYAYDLWYSMRKELSKGFYPGTATKLNKEFGDKLFVSSELVAFAADDQLYVYEVRTNAQNGYWFQYAFGSGETMHKSSINMKRLTAAVNTSFVLTNGYTEGLTNVSPVSDLLAGLEKKYNVDLSKMDCPYATLDGISYTFNANDGKFAKNCGGVSIEGGHLLLWDAETEDRCALANVMYTPSTDGTQSDFGLGIRGNAHAFVFKTGDLEGNMLAFWVQAPINKDGSMVKVKVLAELHEGIQLDQNTNTQIVAKVRTEDFLRAMGVEIPNDTKNSKSKITRSSDGYAVVEAYDVVVK